MVYKGKSGIFSNLFLEEESVSHIEIILEYLEGAYPKQICDDCLSENLNNPSCHLAVG